MPNKPRRCEPNLTYHVKSRCSRLDNLLSEPWVKKIFIDVMKTARKKYNFKYINYIIMDNHFHFIIRTVDGGEPISRIMQYVKARMAERYKKVTGHPGAFWNERFSDIIIEEQENPTIYLFKLLWQMAYSAVEEGKCVDPRSYPWSSIHNYLGEETCSPIRIEKHPFFQNLGNSSTQRIRRFLFFEEEYRKEHMMAFSNF